LLLVVGVLAGGVLRGLLTVIREPCVGLEGRLVVRELGRAISMILAQVVRWLAMVVCFQVPPPPYRGMRWAGKETRVREKRLRGGNKVEFLPRREAGVAGHGGANLVTAMTVP
jgi:hypothetical protein